MKQIDQIKVINSYNVIPNPHEGSWMVTEEQPQGENILKCHEVNFIIYNANLEQRKILSVYHQGNSSYLTSCFFPRIKLKMRLGFAKYLFRQGTRFYLFCTNLKNIANG